MTEISGTIGISGADLQSFGKSSSELSSEAAPQTEQTETRISRINTKSLRLRSQRKLIYLQHVLKFKDSSEINLAPPAFVQLAWDEFGGPPGSLVVTMQNEPHAKVAKVATKGAKGMFLEQPFTFTIR